MMMVGMMVKLSESTTTSCTTEPSIVLLMKQRTFLRTWIPTMRICMKFL